MCDAGSDGEQVHNLFITDVDYEAEETKCGRVMTGTRLEPVATSVIDLWDDQGVSAGDNLLFADVKLDSVVRFVSTISNTVTDYQFVREMLTVNGKFSIRIDAPLLMNHSDQFRLQLVREWLPKPLALLGRFKMITACEIRAYAFCGLSSGNLYEGVTGEPQQDFIGLEIAEIPGSMQSTNRNMERLLAVLPTHMPGGYHPSSWNDSRDAMIFLPEGFAKTRFSSPLPPISTITPRLVDRRGATIKAARFHLWIRLHAVKF
mmetsp:Transcript_21218/g.53771  ORF Transcript_21218/g.53771 Transcript_21218/m.53771 type:complete len:261 (-) Transcript_21218:138-920(-)